MIQHNLIENLSNYTKVPNKILTELNRKAELCIGSAINDALLAGETDLLINIGVGVLSINLTDMQCKFTPGKDLKQIIKTSIASKVDPLELELDKALADKLVAICEGI